MVNMFKKKTKKEYANVFLETEDLLIETKSLNKDEVGLLDSIYYTEQRYNKNKIIYDKYKVIMLGTNYLNWLNEKSYKDTIDNREEYADQLSIEETEKEFIENGGNINIVTMFLPIMIFQDDISKEKKEFFNLTEATLSDLYLELSTNLNISKESIYIIPRIMQSHVVDKHIDKISSMVEKKLMDDINISYGALDNLELNEKINISAFCLAVGLKLNLNSCIIPKDWRTIEEYKVIYSTLNTDRFSAIFMDNFNKMSTNETREVYLLSPMLLFVEEINETYRSFIMSLKKELNKLNMDINLI